MKLAELLIERSECQNKLVELKSQILANLKYQEGDDTDINVKDLLTEFTSLNNKLEKLIVRINTANSKIKLGNGKTLTEAIAMRDSLKSKIDFYKDIVKTSNTKDYRLTRSEIKMVMALNINDILKEIDFLSKEFRLLDNEIQQVNWTSDI